MTITVPRNGPEPTFVVGDAYAEQRSGAIVVTERHYFSHLRAEEHAHEYACLDVVLEGAVSDVCRGQQRHAPAGTVLWYEPHAEHLWASGNRGARLLHTIIPREWLPETGAHRVVPMPAPGVAHALRRAVRDGDPRLEIESLAADLCEQIQPKGQRHWTTPFWIEHVVEKLREPGAQSLSLAELAADTGVSPGHLSRVFRACVGCSPGQFTRRLRVHRAASHLTRTGRTITSIAHELEFADHAHLTRVFRAEVGCTPSSYRAAFRGS